MSRQTARAEQQKEAQESFVLPQAGLAKAVIFFATLGALAALPFGFIEWGGLPTAARLVLSVFIGLVAGGVVGMVVGPSVEAAGESEREVSRSMPRGSRRPE